MTHTYHHTFNTPALSHFASAALGLLNHAAGLPEGVSYDEKQCTYTLEVELPGYTRGDVSVEVLDGVLTVKAENARRGKMTREWVLEGIDEVGLKATLDSGILTITLPQVAISPSRKVEIR